ERDFLCKQVKSCQRVVVKVKDIIHFFLGYHQRVSHYKRIDVEKREIPVIFCYDMRRNFAVDNLREDRAHCLYVVMFRISNSMRPAGVLIFASSPFFFPSSPLPIGESVDILPVLRSASSSDTSVYVIAAPFF